jgi:hypothetical protein
MRIPPWPYELHVVSAAYVHLGDQQGGKAYLQEILSKGEIADAILFAVDPKPPYIFFYGRVGFWLTEHFGSTNHLYPVASKKSKVERKFLGRRLHPDRIRIALIIRFSGHGSSLASYTTRKPVVLESVRSSRIFQVSWS